MTRNRGIVLLAPAAAMLALLLCGTALATHPRPGGGTPFRVPLIPAFSQCTAPDSTHVVPLSSPSCSSPTMESAIVTTNTTGAWNGFSSLKVLCTDAQTPPCTPNDGTDTEDVRVDARVTDIRCAVGGISGCSSPGADYTSQLIAQFPIRITDHSNGAVPICTNAAGNSPCVPATAADFTFSAPMSCIDNGSANGAVCSVGTTLDTLLPTTVKEFQRGVVSVLGVRLADAGPDSSVTPGGGATCPPTCGSGDETRVADQGVFVP